MDEANGNYKCICAFNWEGKNCELPKCKFCYLFLTIKKKENFTTCCKISVPIYLLPSKLAATMLLAALISYTPEYNNGFTS